MRPAVELWNDVLDLPYHRFRQRVREIALLNLGGVEGAVQSEWDAIPEGALVMPVDDDDWFAPDAALRVAAAAPPEIEAYYWLRSFLEFPYTFRHRLHLIARHTVNYPMPYTCTT